MKNRRILALFSGGLDSLIAVFWMKKLSFEVIPIFFETPFFTPEKALKVAQANSLDLKIINITEEHLAMLLSPIYGYGKFFNPCIDCHGLMFKSLGKYLELFQADFLISGEVLNQRPMSQRKDALNAVKKISTLGDLIIRPLSQKLLPDTLPIREGWVSKESLLSISGRSRIEQLRIAKELNLCELQNSGGGCLLTDQGYTKRLKELISYQQLDMNNIYFLKFGRHFRISPQIKLVINRNSNEMEYLLQRIDQEIIIKCLNITGPIGIINSSLPISEDILRICGGILLRYTPKAKDMDFISYGKQFALVQHLECIKYDDQIINQYRINQ